MENAKKYELPVKIDIEDAKCKVQSAKCHCEEDKPDQAIQKENSSTLQPFSFSATSFGFLNVYKSSGMTSHDVVAILRKITKIKQIGHTGTLDPFAQGVLPVAIGKATRLIEFLDDEKEYLAEITFGKSTDTYDCDGRATFELCSKVALKDVIGGLKFFEGEILQTPPIYSAIKVKGKKLYEYARKGEEVQIEPRKVFIEKIELKNFDEKNQKAQVLIKCSKGTYIRSIAHDLGQKLGCGAHLSMLIRTQAGKFSVENSILLDETYYLQDKTDIFGLPCRAKALLAMTQETKPTSHCEEQSDEAIQDKNKLKSLEDIKKNLISPLDVLDFPKIELTEEEHKKVINGISLENKNALQNNNFIILIYNNKINAVAQVNDNLIKVKKVFL